MADDPTGPTLDDEGVPDLEGPLPGKERTGDPQEGVAPPGYRPGASTDWGAVPSEERAGEPLDRRLQRERPDVPPDEDSPPGPVLVGDDLYADDEKDLVASAFTADAGVGQSAEEAAVHVVDDESG
jgi:hypothetical protein